MTIETDLNVMEHAGRTWRFTLTNESGEVLPLDGYVIYGAAECPGRALRAFTVEVKGGVATVRMPGLPAGDWPWKYQLFVQEVSSRVEWLLCCGSVNVLGRVAGEHVALSPEQLEFTGVLDRVTQQASIVVGENMVSIAENARLAAQAALDSQIARAGAEDARDGAEAARSGAEDARDGALAAQGGAEAARDGALAAQGGAEDARDGALAAQGGAENARDGALAALAGAEDARDGALAARSGAEAARDGALVAQAGAKGAQAVAEDAAGVAQGFAQRAAGAADDAVLAAAEAKAAEAGAAGAADAVRFDFLPMTLEWLEGRLEKMYGPGMCSLELAEDEGSLRVAFSLDMGAPQVEEAGALLERVLPRNLVTQMEWADGLPIDYTHVEYLESTGTQYIKLGDYDVVPDTGFEVEFLKHKAQTNGFCGSGNRMSLWHYGHGQVAARYGGGDATLAYMPNDTRIVCKKIDARNWLDGVEQASNTGSNSDVKTYSMWLFATDVYYRSSTVIYSARFWQGAAVLHDVIPALDPTGTPCMFDLISKTPYYNNGTGDFLYPGKEEEATTYSLRRPLMYAQSTAHGIRRLYHVPRGYNGTREEYAAEHGYKVLVETPEPAEGYWQPVWREREDCIELEWETEPPMEETLT